MSTPTDPWRGTHPILWAQLIADAERVRAEYGFGLGSVWLLIRRAEYRAARDRLDDIERYLAETRSAND